MCSRWASFLVVVLSAETVWSFSAGLVGSLQCDALTGMVPGHLVPAQTRPSPYTITVSDTEYAPDQEITVTLSGDSSNNFMGVFIAALNESAGDGTTGLGEFVSLPTNIRVACSGSKTWASHNGPTPKSSVLLRWKAPATAGTGNLKFVATFVKAKVVFWVRQSSSVVRDASSIALPAGPTTPYIPAPSNTVSALDLAGCGSTWSCYTDPEGCQGSGGGCTYAAKWRKKAGSNSQIEMEVSAKTGGWVAVGFSLDAYMGSDTVVACTSSSVSPIRLLWNIGKQGPSSPGCCASVLSNQRVTVAGGEVRCTFTYDSSIVSGNIYDLSSRKYRMLIGRGPLNSGSIGFHDELPLASPVEIDFHSTDFINIGGRAVDYLVKAHGAIMVVAWMACASIGIILSRYYKPMWARSRACGEKIWFQIHRSLMITAMGLTIIGLIIIFVSVSRRQNGVVWSMESELPAKAHPILGIIAACLAVLNPFMALFRCAPESKKRPIFNWSHWFVGTVAYVFAGVSVVLGARFDQAAVPKWLWAVPLAFYAIHIVFAGILSGFEYWQSKHGSNGSPSTVIYNAGASPDVKTIQPKKDKEDNIALRTKGDVYPGDEPEVLYAGRGFKSVVLVIYLVLNILFSLIVVGVILGSK